MTSRSNHTPVMVKECLEGFKGAILPVFFDGTVGAGGHAAAFLEGHPEIERYIGCDLDPTALEIAAKRLMPWKGKVELVRGNFRNLDVILSERGINQVNGFFFDFGVSSMQLDQGEKGFSFSKEGPLDMRMDPEGEVTAADIVNSYSEEKLGKIFRELGEEPQWKKAARAIASARSRQPIERTNQLASILATVLSPKRGGRLHPATLVFQALRIAVNGELEAIESGILKALQWLAPRGLIGAISFNGLEDKIVKNLFRDACCRPKKASGCLNILTKKPLTASREEMRDNPRSRSAKLRFAEKIDL